MTPRFARGDRVVTPKHGTGVVAAVFSGPVKTGPTYTVAVDGQENAIVCHETELRAASPAGKLPHTCRACQNSRSSYYAANVTRCIVFKQQRSLLAPRKCSGFIPLQEAANVSA